MIHLVAEYCSSVFFSMITKSDSLELEHIQMQALKSIYGWKLSYSTLLEKSGTDRLDARHEATFIALATKLSESPHYTEWFPLQPIICKGLRATDMYKLYPATSEHYYKSPLNRMCRKLNEINKL